MYSNENERSIKFVENKATESIVLQYLILENLRSKNYGDEYIKMMYHFNAQKIESVYNVLDPAQRDKVRTQLEKQIKAGEINLKDETVKLYKASLHRNNNDNNEDRADIEEEGERY